MSETDNRPNASATGTFDVGGDLAVNRLGFGTMRLCGPGVWGEPEDPEVALGVLRRAPELGVNLIDTTDAYGPEVNERQIVEALTRCWWGKRLSKKSTRMPPSSIPATMTNAPYAPLLASSMPG